jgi:putative SOS response-associated peptidase YedK
MCGRVRLISDYSEIKIKLKFGDGDGPNMPPSWNTPPTGDMLVAIRSESGARVPEKMRWGLLPSWAKDPKLAFSTFNARADGIDTKPAFRGAWKAGRRCLVVTDGFYEWRKRDKQSFAVAMADDSPMIMAGLWEEWRSPEGERIRSVTVITTEANELVAEIHDRMPVIMAETDWPQWLGEITARPEELKARLAPSPSEWLKIWKVDKRVGNVRNNDSGLIRPIRDDDPPATLL